MKIPPHLQKRMDELLTDSNIMLGDTREIGHLYYVSTEKWEAWSTSALNLLGHILGEESIHFRQLHKFLEKGSISTSSARGAIAVFRSAKLDIEADVVGSLETRVSGELFAGFIVTAKAALTEGQKDVASVLACAALEDTLKKYAALHGLDIQNKTMDAVVGALKGASLVSGVQKGLLDAMPRIRNAAMHADWQKITEPDVASVIGFTEQFLLTHLS